MYTHCDGKLPLECLAIHVDAGIHGEQAVEVMERICAQYGTPVTIQVDKAGENSVKES